MKRALVTGHRGFVGRHMVKELVSRGYRVTGWDLPEHEAVDLFRRAYRQDYDLLVHCAYRVGGRAAIDGVNTNLAKNLMLDAAMFDYAVRSGNVGHVLYFSSSAVYPVDLQDGRYTYRLEECCAQRFGQDEHGDQAPWPDADYGWAKMNGERLAEMARANGVGVSVVRPFSGYGADQSGDYPFPSIVRRAMHGDLSVWGPKGQTRDWIHVSDLVKGALAVVTAQTVSSVFDEPVIGRKRLQEPVNLCTGRAVEMGDLAKMVAQQAHLHDCFRYPGVMGEPSYDESKPTGVFYRVGDPTRMLTYYTPTVTLEQGIEEAIRHARMA